MSDKPSIKTTITLPTELLWKFKEKAAQRRLADKDAFVEAIKLWMSRADVADGKLKVPNQHQSANSVGSEGREWHSTLYPVAVASLHLREEEFTSGVRTGEVRTGTFPLPHVELAWSMLAAVLYSKRAAARFAPRRRP